MRAAAKTLLVLTMLIPISAIAADPSDLERQVERLSKQVQMLQQQLNTLLTMQPAASTSKADVHPNNTAGDAPASVAATSDASSSKSPALVDLSVDELTSIDEQHAEHVLAKPWWRNFTISGFAAVGLYDTGSAGTRNHGGFEIKEASLFIEADIWRNAGFFLEFQTNRLGKDNETFTRTGEAYLHFREIELARLFTFGMKLGRIDIPFGEEYLWQDSIDNPLITTSAAYPYGFDEGLLVYGSHRGINWIVSVTDGSDARSIEDNSEKAWNVKVYGNPLEQLYMALSFMSNGEAGKSAFEFGGSHFRPVGAAHSSSSGASPSDTVDALLGQVDLKYHLLTRGTYRAYVAGNYGVAEQFDDASGFDRTLQWFSVEPYISYRGEWYTVVRYSEIGTYDSTEGYHFDGKTFAGGNSAFGYDVRRFRRLGVGFGWTPNPNLRAKFEIGKDWFDLIEASPLSANNSQRTFLGLEVAGKF